jgi:hypothetical protein
MEKKTIPYSWISLYEGWKIVGYENYVAGIPTHAEIVMPETPEEIGLYSVIPPIKGEIK